MTMNCPVCAIPLSMSTRQNVEIDYCPQCRGVWLDRGELDKIIERSAADIAPPPAPTTAQPHDLGYAAPQQQSYGYRHNERYKYKRKKSFLEELFD